MGWGLHRWSGVRIENWIDGVAPRRGRIVHHEPTRDARGFRLAHVILKREGRKIASEAALPKHIGVFADQIKHALGLPSLKVRTAIEVHERIAEGLPRAAALNLVSSLNVIPLEESLGALNLSHRSWRRFKAEPGRVLDVDRSARVWSFAEILTKAFAVLGTRGDVEAWLAHRAQGLGGRRPIELMST